MPSKLLTTTVFVHGNSETAAVWSPLLAALERADVICLSPPGFGAPLPNGFSATPTGYREWLVDCLEQFARPVDLVGHDWGGAHVLNAAAHRPDLVRSWVTDAAGVFDPDYVWHELAQTWQTPGAGEELVARSFGAPLDDRVRAMTARGIAGPTAERLAAGMDYDMGRAVLALYRSAAQPAMAGIGAAIDRAGARPGLVLSVTGDASTGTEAMRRRIAARTGAQFAALGEMGHWWMDRDPAGGAAALTRFWNQLT